MPIATDIKPMKVRFTAADGTVHVVGVDGDHHVGAQVRVLYDPAHPDVAVTQSLTKRHFWAIWKMVGTQCSPCARCSSPRAPSHMSSTVE
ncbi:hypothetical protein [Actinoallomurus sp. CA-150999]|uniref:hypothetical protein n=1 Tax=Actinoallomurus sp. CA-150999 TaxID=3239887 RepID=UPI003D8D021D